MTAIVEIAEKTVAEKLPVEDTEVDLVEETVEESLVLVEEEVILVDLEEVDEEIDGLILDEVKRLLVVMVGKGVEEELLVLEEENRLLVLADNVVKERLLVADVLVGLVKGIVEIWMLMREEDVCLLEVEDTVEGSVLEL